MNPETDPNALDSSSVRNTSSVSGSKALSVSEALLGTIVTTEETDSNESSFDSQCVKNIASKPRCLNTSRVPIG
jgi:hypothetical protein